MLVVGSALRHDRIEATDGHIGTVSDFLFDDASWKLRWMVVDAGSWLTGRKVLLHPSAIGGVNELREISIKLTRQQVKDSPDFAQDLPVTRQMEARLYGHYGWDASWNGFGYFGGYPSAIGLPFVSPPVFGGSMIREDGLDLLPDDADPHLRSLAAMSGYRLEAADGPIGHLEDVLIDDATWDIRYLIVDTRNWWPGKHVLVSPFAVQEISWAEHNLRVTISREQVTASPAWSPMQPVDQDYEKDLHRHYGWPGYGFAGW